MHIGEGSVVTEFMEESINFQTEDVLVLYAAIFTVLLLVCVTYFVRRMRGEGGTQPECDHARH